MLHFTTAVVYFFQIKQTASVALGVYAFIGVDIVEGFYGCGKVSIMKRTLKCNDKSHMETMQRLGMKNELSDDMLLCLQEFTTRIVYNDPVSRELCEARARKWRIPKNNDSARLPPDRDSFKQHCLRAHLQAYEWRHAELAQSLPASQFGWISVDDVLHPVMHTIDALLDGLNFAEAVSDIPDNKGDEEFDDSMSSSDSSNSDEDDDDYSHEA